MSLSADLFGLVFVLISYPFKDRDVSVLFPWCQQVPAYGIPQVAASGPCHDFATPHSGTPVTKDIAALTMLSRDGIVAA